MKRRAVKFISAKLSSSSDRPKLESRLGQQLKIGEFDRPLSRLTSATLLGIARGQFPYVKDEINTTCILGFLGWSHVSIYA